MTQDERAELTELRSKLAVHEDRWRAYFAWRDKTDERVNNLQLSGAKLAGLIAAASFIAGLIPKLLSLALK